MGRIGRIKIAALMLAAVVASLGAQAPVSNEAATARKFAAIRSNPLALEAFLREMPKGGDLHNHASGGIYAESYFRWAVEDGMCMTVATFSFVAASPSAPCDASAGRPAASAVLAHQPLYNEAIDALSIRHFPANLNGHDHFFAAFGKFGAVSSTHAGEMLAELSSRAAEEHVSYLELMITPYAGNPGRGAGWTPDFAQMRAKLLASPEWNAILASAKQRLDAFEARRNAVQKCGTPSADAGCLVVIRYVAQVARAVAPEEVFGQIMAGFEVGARDPRVVGINLVQPEDAPIALRDFSLQMKMLAYLHPFYPGVHLSLHAGELVDGLVPPDALRFHISESVRIAHAERIGHGVAVMNEDRPYELLREMAQKKVLVEINLTSNDSILGVKGRRHPLLTYLQYGVPVAISTDDYGVARSSHTLEFLKAVQEHNLDYVTVKRLVRNSIEYAFAGAATKAQLKRDLEAAFKDFETRQ